MFYRTLGKRKIEKIHEATLQMLSKTGIIIEHKGARKLLQSYGAQPEDNRILIPPELVEESIEQCPKTVTLEGRDPKKAIEIGSNKLYAHNLGGAHSIYTLKGKRREANRIDVSQATRLLDYLPNVSSITPFFTPKGLTAEVMPLWRYYDTVRNTTKPIRGPAVESALELKAIVEMAKIAGTEKSLIANISSISPLKFQSQVADVIFEAAKQGIPINVFPCPMMGSTAPVTYAGALALQNAELLAAIVIAQLKHPGLPVVYRGRLSIANHFNANSQWGSSDIGKAAVGTVELGHYYNLPVNVYGFSTDAHTPDAQAGFEKLQNALMPILAGAHEISGIGELDGGKAGSLIQIVMDDEMMNNIKNIRKKNKINDDTLAVDILADVVRRDDSTSSFLFEQHTAIYQRKDEILPPPDVANRKTYGKWEEDGCKGIVENATEKVKEILRTHKVEPLKRKQLEEMRKVIKAAYWENKRIKWQCS